VTERPHSPLPEPPADLAAFWRERRRRAEAVDPEPRVVEQVVTDGIRRLRLTYRSTDEVRIGAWVTMPADGAVERCVVRLHGYGGLAEADVRHPALERTAVIWPCLRGMGELSRAPGLSDVSREHVLRGIASRDDYIHGGCVDDVWLAVDALAGVVPDAVGRRTAAGAARARVGLVGGSFGGGIGVMAAAWDERVAAVVLEVPSFGNHPVRVRIPCEGSGQAVRERWLAEAAAPAGDVSARGGVLDVLAYWPPFLPRRGGRTHSSRRRHRFIPRAAYALAGAGLKPSLPLPTRPRRTPATVRAACRRLPASRP
jgi:cephalosporin-C deacetylase